ncbi:MAG: DNA-binding protein WhiA [Actinomycetota bacterium]
MSESFSRTVRSELSHIRAPRECCRRSELVAFVRASGTVHLLAGSTLALEVEAPDAGVARAVYQALSALGAGPEVRLFSPGASNPHERFVVRFETQDRVLLEHAGAIDASGLPPAGVPAEVASKRCCSGAYLRASFIVHGTVSAPRSSAHLEIRAQDAQTAGGIVKLAHNVGARMRTRERRGFGAYTKDVASIGALLAAMGAHGSYLEWEAGGVWSTIRNEANRLANADRANVRRTVTASIAQRDAIRKLDSHGALDAISEALRDAARFRLEHPDATLSELAQMMGISRSAVAERLRRLVALAAPAPIE